MSVSTRLARITDGARVGKLLDGLRKEMGYTGQASIPLPSGHDGPLFVILAERDDALLGMLSAQRCHNLVRGLQFLLVTDIYVSSAHRQKGVATDLMNASMALARRTGCESVSMVVSDINNAALATAARAGFVKNHDLLLTYRP